MPAATRCPECGAALDGPPDQPCPACLIRLGLASWQSRPGGLTTTPAPPPGPALPAAEVQARLSAYEVHELIGQGGMGAVYRARHKALGRDVALKVLHAAAPADGSFPERFQREAHALARLTHPHIVQVYDYGTADGLPYLAMEYVDGANLRRLMADGHLTPEEALRLVPPICAALQYAHAAGVVHRDIKPENILVSRTGEVKIADFGLAKLTGPVAADTLTGSHQVMGTPRYMAPEQLESTRRVDHRADIYSLGVVLYELLTGELPLGRFDPPSHRAAVNPGLDGIVLRTLEKDPGRRYQDADELKSDLEDLAAGRAPRGARYRRRDAEPAPSRFSLKAVAGAAWAAFFPLALVAFAASFLFIQGVTVGPSLATAPARSLTLLGLVLFALGLSAPLGCTVLGVIATSDIRHARGHLRGLGLAVFDSLLFPLLLLDLVLGAAFVAVLLLLLRLGVGLVGWSPTWAMVLWPGLVTGLALAVTLDVLIARAVWRRVNRPPAPARPSWRDDSLVTPGSETGTA